MSTKQEERFEEDILGLQTASQVLKESTTQEAKNKVLGLMLLMLERLTIQVEDRLRQ